jgi:UDP-N-acetylmuramyl tripeptide synthase
MRFITLQKKSNHDISFRVRTFLAVFICRISTAILRLFGHGGTALPGRLALFINKDLLLELSKDVRVTLITGTNGKSTVCRMTEQIFSAAGIKVFSNRSGANMPACIAAEFARHSNLRGQCLYDRAVIECDEAAMLKVCRQLFPECIVITNISSDQTDRFGTPENTARLIKESISHVPDAVLCLNNDCPLTGSLARGLANSFIRFGVKNGNSPYLLIGSIEQKLSELNTGFPEIYNLYNAAAAAAASAAANIDVNISEYALKRFECVFGRGEDFALGLSKSRMILVKNPAGFNYCLEQLLTCGSSMKIVFIINNAPADGTDIAWLKAVNFETLSRKQELFTDIYISGTCSDALSARLLESGFEQSKLKIIKSYSKLLKAVSSDDIPTLFLPNYTAMFRLRQIIARRTGLKKFYE